MIFLTKLWYFRRKLMMKYGRLLQHPLSAKMKIMENEYPFIQIKYDICYTSFPRNFSVKNILLVDLSDRRVYPLSMFTLRCHFTTYNFGNFVNFWAELFLRINLNSYFHASFFSGILWISGIADLQHWIFLNFSDILLMSWEESGVIFLFLE